MLTPLLSHTPTNHTPHHRKCTGYTAQANELHSFVVNGITTAILIIPGVILNTTVILQYRG